MPAKRPARVRVHTRVFRCLMILPFVVAAACLAAWWCFRPGPSPEPEKPVMRITFDGGGSVVGYIEKYNELRLAGGRVILDGMCISACTMVVGLIPADRVCATPYGQLAFHSAFIQSMMGREHSSEGTRIVWHTYPDKVRKLLLAKEWDGDDKAKNEHPDLIYVAGDELATIIRPCGAGEG